MVIDGRVQGVHMLWIDNRLYYTSQSQHLNPYAFEVEPGTYNLRFRTFSREVFATNFHLEEGKRHIVSFNAGKAYAQISYKDSPSTFFVLKSKLLDKQERGYLSEKEERELYSQLITVDNNFGEIVFPNMYQRIQIPGYINSGEMLYYLNHSNQSTYNHSLRAQVRNPILAGPFPKRSLKEGLANMASVYAGDHFLTHIEIEGGNQYTLYPDYQKIKQWDRPVIKKKLSWFTPTLNFRQEPLTVDEIKRQVKNRIAEAMCSSSGIIHTPSHNTNFNDKDKQLILILGIDRTGVPLSPTLLFFEPKKEEDRKEYQLYYGGSRTFNHLPTEELTLHLIFKDSTSYSHPIQLHKGGKNYLKLDSIAPHKEETKIAEIAYNLFHKEIKTHYPKNPYVSKTPHDTLAHSPSTDSKKISSKNRKNGVITGVVKDRHEPIIGASVRIKGTDNGTFTDFDGRFELEAEGHIMLEISYIGYLSKEIKGSVGYVYDIVLEENEQHLNEVVVTGYATQKRKALTGVIIQDNSLASLDHQALEGKMAGLYVRGASSTDPKVQPLIIVNGLPYDGNIEDIDTNSILSVNLLKEAAATAIYGSRGANGVIMIETNAPASPLPADIEGSIPEEAGNSMRRNFHDDAFWQPRLKTDDQGKVHFEVTYPDDITHWNAYFVALGGKKQSDTKQISIRSFKSLSARLSTPRFAIQGDSLNAVGKIANHFGDSLQLTRTIDLNNHKEVEKIEIDKSHIDYIPIRVTQQDSLTLAYSLQMENGYFDGEERSFPILEQGLLQTYGDFKVINDSATHTLRTKPELGTITIHAEASSLELFLREIEQIDRYPYMCNEQMASKIKALLAKKYIYNLQDKEFEEGKKIKSLIKDLNKNKNKEGLWGWWNKSESVMWISEHILNALLDAEEAGYETQLDKQALAATFEKELKNNLSHLPWVVNNKSPYIKEVLLDRLILLKKLEAPLDYEAYLYEINAQLKDRTTKERLKTMLTMASTGQVNAIEADSLMHYSSKTILGSLYWGEKKEQMHQPRFFYLPQETNIENTLLAYQILKRMGGYEKELESLRNYFFEQRQRNTWNNIYESSRIIQTIMPDLLKESNQYTDVVMHINGNRISKFPYTREVQQTEKIQVRKTGNMPLFVTAYQKKWNEEPKKENTKGLEISTLFMMNKDTIADLKEGQSTLLQVTLNLEGEAEYVQIEVPIPAGCSYESKLQGWHWKEAHREHYKEKVVIFCNPLTKGTHHFNVELLPRYTGRYTLNPAKAELMYFPVFYGNEETKTIVIQ